MNPSFCGQVGKTLLENQIQFVSYPKRQHKVKIQKKKVKKWHERSRPVDQFYPIFQTLYDLVNVIKNTLSQIFGFLHNFIHCLPWLKKKSENLKFFCNQGKYSEMM